jgi:magnesium-transporting ATPase (P-type)
MPKAGWREYIIAIFLVLAGFTYLVLQVISMSRGDNSTINADGEVIHINRYAFFNEVRTYVTIACCIAGGLLLVRLKKAGWILSLCMILLFTSIALAASINLFALGIDDASRYLALGGSLFLLFLLVLLFLLQKKFVLQKNDWIRATLLCTALGLLYFLLQ